MKRDSEQSRLLIPVSIIPNRKVKNIFYNFLFLSLVIVDQITKLIFSNRDFFVGPIHVYNAKNFGLAFSINLGLLPNLSLIFFGLFFLLYYFLKHKKELSDLAILAFILIFGGGVSNIIDRLYLGYVRDFLDLGLGFTFNLSDLYIAAGLIMVVLYKVPIEERHE
jgi:signal peptidase II